MNWIIINYTQLLSIEFWFIAQWFPNPKNDPLNFQTTKKKKLCIEKSKINLDINNFQKKSTESLVLLKHFVWRRFFTPIKSFFQSKKMEPKI